MDRSGRFGDAVRVWAGLSRTGHYGFPGARGALWTNTRRQRRCGSCVCRKRAGGSGGRCLGESGGDTPIDLPVELGVSRHDLNVLTGLGDGYGFDEFRRFLIILASVPLLDVSLACIVGGQRRLRRAVDVEQIGEIQSSDLHIVLWIQQTPSRLSEV